MLPFECRPSDTAELSFGVCDRAWIGPLPQAGCDSSWLRAQHVAQSPPVELLLASAALSKRYQVDWLLHVLVDVVQSRICDSSFESILLAAMAHDIAPVRLGALDFARRSHEVRWRYDAGEFPQDIIFELQAAFPVPPARLSEANTISI